MFYCDRHGSSSAEKWTSVGPCPKVHRARERIEAEFLGENPEAGAEGGAEGGEGGAGGEGGEGGAGRSEDGGGGGSGGGGSSGRGFAASGVDPKEK